MTAKSKYRGNEIEYIGKDWIYSDTKEVVKNNKHRACGNCGSKETKEGHDACLGELPGLTNACCGHGNDSEAYIQFYDGKEIRGVQARKIQLEMIASEVELNHEADSKALNLQRVVFSEAEVCEFPQTGYRPPCYMNKEHTCDICDHAKQT